MSVRSISASTTDIKRKDDGSEVKDDIKQGNSSLQPCSLLVDMEEDYMEDYPMEEGEDTDEFEDIENEDENDPDDLFERTLEVKSFHIRIFFAFCTHLCSNFHSENLFYFSTWKRP